MILIALALFIPGFIIVRHEDCKEDPSSVNHGLKVLGYILMAVAVIIGLGSVGVGGLLGALLA